MAVPVQIAHVLGRPMSGSFDLGGSLEVDQRTAVLDEYARLDEQHARLAQTKGRALLDTAKALVTAGDGAPLQGSGPAVALTGWFTVAMDPTEQAVQRRRLYVDPTVSA